MRIIKPYGQTRVEYTDNADNTDSTPRTLKRTFIPNKQTNQDTQENQDVQIKNKILDDYLSKDPEALIAAWVSAIDKIFGKGDDKSKKNVIVNAQQETTKNPQSTDQQANQKKEIDYAPLRAKVLECAFDQVLVLLGTLPAGTTEDDIKQKWNHKLNLSPPNDTKGNSNKNSSTLRYSKGGRWAGRFLDPKLDPNVYQNPEVIVKLADDIVESIYMHIHIKEFPARRDKGKEKRHGLISNRTYSVSVNTSNKVLQHLYESEKAKTRPNRALQDIVSEKGAASYPLSGSKDIVAKIYARFEKGEDAKNSSEKNKGVNKTDEDGENLSKPDEDGENLSKLDEDGENPSEQNKRLNRKDFYAAINLLSEHWKIVFVDANIEVARSDKPKEFDLHQAIKAAYKKLFARKQVLLGNIPKNMTEMLSLIEKHQSNRDINSLIRLGKVIHHDWMNTSNPSTLDLEALGKIDENQSYFWTSLGQFKIKRDEAFLRVWRHCLSLAVLSFANWVDPDKKRGTDVLGADFTFKPKQSSSSEKLLTIEPKQLSSYAKLLFGEQLDSRTDLKPLITYTQSLLASFRNQVFHYKGLPLFIELTKNIDGENEKVPDVVYELYRQDLSNRQNSLFTILKGMQIDQYLTIEEIKKLEPLLCPSDSEIPLPRFSKLMKRAENLKSSAFEPYLPRSTFLKDQEHSWAECRYALLKLVYENAFAHWLNEKDSNSSAEESEVSQWLKNVCEKSTKRAKDINKKDQSILSKAAKILNKRESDKLTIKQFFNLLTSETQKLSGSYNEKNDAQENIEAIQNYMQDVIIFAFEEFCQDQGAMSLFKRANKSTDPKGSIDELKSCICVEEPAQKPDDRFEFKAQMYYLMHLIPNDAVSLLLHQLKKWNVLSDDRDKPLNQSEQSNQSKLLKLFAKDCCEIMALYLLTGKAKSISLDASTPNTEKEKTWLANLYENGSDDVNKLFTQGEKNVWIPRRHVREMMRFGYNQSHKSESDNDKIKGTEVEEWLSAVKAVKNEGERIIVSQHKELQRLHKKWVDKKKRIEYVDRECYKKDLNSVIKYKQLKSRVLLLDEFKRYQLLMRVLARMVDYAGLWERDAIYLITVVLYQLKQCKPEFSLNNEQLESFNTGQWGRVWRENIKKYLDGVELLEPHKTIIQSCIKALDDMLKNKCIRNEFAHFNSNMLGKDSSEINLIKQIEDVRTLMAYDRKLKNSVTYAIVDLFKREGLILKFKFGQEHELQLGVLVANKIIHLKNPQGKGIPEAQHSQEYVNSVKTLFGEKV